MLFYRHFKFSNKSTMSNKITFLDFMKTNLIKRDVLEQMNKSKLRRYCTISAILYLVTLIFSFIISWTPLYSFSNFLFALCGTFICYYLLKEKVNLNNTCPKCNDNNFYPKIETKKTTVSISTSKSIYERGANGKYIGSYQEGTQIDGAKYTISESTSIKENTFYDWQCNTCNYLKNYKESFSHFIYLICILLGIYLIYGAVFGLY